MKRKTVWWWGGAILAVLLALPWFLWLEVKDALAASIAVAGVVGVVVNLFLTRERIDKQEKQSNRQQEQFREQQRDARFASGVELLGNPHESTRIGGAYNLYFLARDFEELRPAVCEILCAHLRTVTSDKVYQETHTDEPSIEVQTIIDIMFMEYEKEISFFSSDCFKNLRKAFLSNVNFQYKTINETSFVGASLTQVYFSEAVLTNVIFKFARLNRVPFVLAKLVNVDFFGASTPKRDFFTLYFRDTPLEGYSYEEITRPGRSLELTRPKAAEPAE
jgi:hypothetical protein